VYPILLGDEAVISEFVAKNQVVNVNLRPGGALTLERAASLGVRRVTYAASLFSSTMAALENLANQIHGEMSGLPGQH
jgi:2-methylisocitrate lyase-like PEP mutase family enzyme